MDSGKPKKRAKKKSVDLPPLASQDQVNIQQLLADVLKEKQFESLNARTVASLNTALIHTLNEFLNCYMLLGYDSKGSAVVISMSKTDLEQDALNSLLIKFFNAVTMRLAKSSNDFNME